MPRHTITGGGGLKLAVHEYGRPDGKAILLIHGFSQCHLSWVKQIQSALAEEFRLVCVDIRGHGMSEKPVAPENYTDADKWAADVHAILEGLALRKPILVGTALVVSSAACGKKDDKPNPGFTPAGSGSAAGKPVEGNDKSKAPPELATWMPKKAANATPGRNRCHAAM